MSKKYVTNSMIVDMMINFYGKNKHITGKYRCTPSWVHIFKAYRAILEDMEITHELSYEDIEKRFHFNTAISAIMELVNDAYKFELKENSPADHDIFVLREALEAIIRLLAPITPHFSEELWQEMGHMKSLYLLPWLKYEKTLLDKEEKLIIVQVNGKLRDRVTVSAAMGDEQLKEQVLTLPKIQNKISGKEIVKVIVVPGKLVNIVIK